MAWMTKSSWFWALVFTLVTSPALAGQGGTKKLAPLPKLAANAWRQVTPDPPPTKLAGNWHFFASNEQRLEQFRRVITGLGGIAIGVGTDQNYLLGGWAKPEMLVLVDFDQMVVDLHEVYRAFFLYASSPAKFMSLWSPRATVRARGIIARAVPNPAKRRRVQRVFKLARLPVYVRLKKQQRYFRRLKTLTFLSDQQQYEYLVTLFRTGRVLAIRGDLTGKKTMAGIARAARKTGLPVRLLYLSNAEQYFQYGSSFRKNIFALPVDDKSLVLRTQHMTKKHGFAYVVQRLVDFRYWLRNKRTRRLRDLLQLGGPHWSRSPVVLPRPPQTKAAKK